MIGQCAVHPDATSEAICERCGRFCCANCLERSLPNKQWCLECALRVPPVQKQSYSTRAMVAFACGVLSIQCLFPLGIAALIAGYQELAAFADGETNETSRDAARVGVITGWVSVGLMVLAGLGFAVFAAVISATAN